MEIIIIAAIVVAAFSLSIVVGSILTSLRKMEQELDMVLEHNKLLQDKLNTLIKHLVEHD